MQVNSLERVNMSAELGKVVRTERKAQKLTQQRLGNLAETGLNFVSQLERGKRTVRLDKVLAVLKVLGLELRIVRGKNSVSSELKRARP